MHTKGKGSENKVYQERLFRGERARKIREKLLGLTREDFKDKYGVSISTLQMWEDVNYGGMNESAAKKLIKIFQNAGINISLEYLMYGYGQSPFDDIVSTPATIESIKDKVIKELQLFYKHNQNAAHFTVNDNTASPLYIPGDLVAGVRFFGEDINNIVDSISIVELETGEIKIRIVKQGDAGNFSLVTFNRQILDNQDNIKLLSAAPIMWVRRIKIQFL